jgi:hypothetical protein
MCSGTIAFLGFQHGQRADRLPDPPHLTCLVDSVLIVDQRGQAVLGDRFGQPVRQLCARRSAVWCAYWLAY